MGDDGVDSALKGLCLHSHTAPHYIAVLTSRGQEPAHPHKASLVLQTYPRDIAADASKGKEGTASPLGSSLRWWELPCSRRQCIQLVDVVLVGAAPSGDA